MNIYAVRRLPSGKVQVRTQANWIGWSIVGDDVKAKLVRDARLQSVRQGGEYDTDPWKVGPWEVELIKTDDLLDKAPEGGQTQQGDQQGETQTDSDQKVSGGNETDPTFKMPGSEDGESTGDAGGGDVEWHVVRLTEVESPDGEIGLVTSYDKHDDAFSSKAVPLAQEIMAQTVEFVRVDIAHAVGTLAEETDTAILALEARTDHAISELAKIKGEGGSGVTVKVEIISQRETKQLDGLFHNAFPMLVKLAAAGQHCYLPGPPGTGKSHAAKQVADALGYEFASISLGPTTPESRLMGGMDANGRFHEPPFVAKARFASENKDSGAVFCLDEMDNGHPGILATLNSAMANGWFTVPNGDTISWGNNFVVVGCANTFGTGPTAEFSGRNRLDAATLDRFAYVPWETDLDVEKTLVNSHLAEHPKGAFIAKDWLAVWYKTRQLVESNGIKCFVTMRGAVNGAKMLAMDINIKDVWNLVLGNKLPEDQRRKINPL